MGSLADIVISFLNLMEAEGKALRTGIMRLAIALALAAVMALLFLTGFGLIVWAIYLFLRIKVDPAVAALLDGLITLVLAGIILWIAKTLSR